MMERCEFCTRTMALPAPAVLAVDHESWCPYADMDLFCRMVKDSRGPRDYTTANEDVLTWQGGTVKDLVLAAYEGAHTVSGLIQDADMMVLADALEEAGYDFEPAVKHLRSPGPHTLDCWAANAVLGCRMEEFRKRSLAGFIQECASNRHKLYSHLIEESNTWNEHVSRPAKRQLALVRELMRRDKTEIWDAFGDAMVKELDMRFPGRIVDEV